VKSSVCIAILKPSPSSPSRFAAGIEVLLDRDARRVHRNDERRQAAVALGRVGLGEDDRPRRVPRVGDERLGAVEDVLVAAPLGGGLDPRDVGPRVRLAQPERAQDRLLEQRDEPVALLLVRAREEDGPGPERVGRQRDGHPGAAPRELLADQDAVEGGEPEASVLLRDVDVHQAELVRRLDHVGRVRLVLVVVGRLGPDLLLGELARERAQLLLLLRERERDPRRRRLHDRHCLSLLR
jgi:hypothetical protein